MFLKRFQVEKTLQGMSLKVQGFFAVLLMNCTIHCGDSETAVLTFSREQLF